MLNYTGTPCPVCDKRFNDDDDVVVCPICGAPYHRHCYNEKGECIFHDLHEKNEAWVAPEIKMPNTAPAHEIKDQECKTCGVLNGHSSLFCSQCGSALKMSPDQHVNREATQQNPYHVNVNPQINPQIMFDPMGGVNTDETATDNVTFGDLSKVVKVNNQYYLPTFNRLKNMNKSRFNFVGFIFSGGWLLYRKQYKAGIIVSVLMLLFYLGQTFSSIFITYPILLKYGVDLYGNVSMSDALEISSLIQPSELLLMSIPNIFTMLMFGVMLYVGITANRNYMKHCIKTVNKTRQVSVNEHDYESTIQEKGGVSTASTLCVLACFLICTYLPMIFL